jgi:anti-sigma regulatory factor (Ser/Thr protein kinase)
VADEAVVHGGLTHLAFFYRDQAEYLARIQAFAHDGLANAEPLFVAVPAGKAQLVRTQLGGGYGGVAYGDMAELGRNPGRIIPAVRAFAESHPGRRVRYICEPVWPGRSAAETCEATRYEALINLALANTPVSIMCLYDAIGLAPAALLEARFTHPALLQDGQPLSSADFAGAGLLPPECDRPLPAAPSYAQTLGYGTDLRPVRRLVTAQARSAGLPPERAADLVLAVSEIAANTLRHTSGDGLLRVWHTEQEILCQVQDHGWITDPLAGQRRRPADEPGHGLWVVHQVCDLVEVRTGEAGTTVRLHMRLGEVRTWHAQAAWSQAAGTARTPPGSPG